MTEEEREAFRAAISGPCAEIGAILTEDMDRQRQEVADKIRALLTMARGRVGGEFAEALLQVMLVTDRWHLSAAATSCVAPAMPVEAAIDDILTAIETGLGARTP